MSLLTRLLHKLASPEDKERLRANPRGWVRLRVLARVSLRFWPAYVAMFLLASVITIASGMDVYHRTELPEFCGACHEMGYNFESWENSVHKGVLCIECHARSGISGWISAKLSGTRQLLTHFTADSIDDIHLGNTHREIVSVNCQRCHEGAVRVDDAKGLVISHRTHLDANAMCVDCHSGPFVHPDPELEEQEVSSTDAAACHSCHNGEPFEGSDPVFASNDEASCERCHPDSGLGLEHGGGQDASGAEMTCFGCHDEADGHYSMQGLTGGAICAGCHEVADGGETPHEPFGDGDCQSCHLVMSQAHLYKRGPTPSNMLCFGCHEEYADLPLEEPEGFATPFADGDEDMHQMHAEQIGDWSDDWCLGCHDPHAGVGQANINLRWVPLEEEEEPGSWTFEASGSGGTCEGACHEGFEAGYARAAPDEVPATP